MTRSSSSSSSPRLVVPPPEQQQQQAQDGDDDAIEEEDNHCDAFTELEHTNWQRGVEAYNKGFGPLTSQAVPTLLDRAGFLSSSSSSKKKKKHNRHDHPGGDDDACRLLDVACGPGQVIDAAISKASQSRVTTTTGAGGGGIARGCHCHYTALDFSTNFLTLAQQTLASKHPHTQVTFVEGDAQDLSSVLLKGSGESNDDDDDDTSLLFDSITCNFGILHLASPESFLSESYKVLKPGGRLAFSAWAAPPTTEAFDLILNTVREVGNPNVPLPDGPAFFRFANPPTIVQSLEAAGFVNIDVTTVDSMEWTGVESSETLYEILLEGTARTRELLKGQTKEETQAIKEELKRRFDQRVSSNEGRRLLRMPAVVSSGQKPE